MPQIDEPAPASRVKSPLSHPAGLNGGVLPFSINPTIERNFTFWTKINLGS
jgi:hypothetical protein